MSHCIIAVPHLLGTALYSFSIVFRSDQALDFPADICLHPGQRPTGS
jgi:hypothetical protein